MSETNDNAVGRGIENLLANCALMQPGQRLLIVHENSDTGYYDPKLTADVASVASQLGLKTELYEVAFSPDVTIPEPALEARISAADNTLFLARIGDQLRFSADDKSQSQIVSYALDRRMMGSYFGTANYNGFTALKSRLDDYLLAADDIRVTCPLGTDFRGKIAKTPTPKSDVSIKRFPMSVFKPVNAATFSGRIAQSGFLIGTGSNYYSPYARALQETLFVEFEGNQIVGFDGDAEDIKAAKSHYEHVGQKYGIDPYYVHSWHSGIHPGCGFVDPPSANYERWTGGAFGNPRLLHFHTCGAYPPGEISLNVVDTTVLVDGVALWEAGVLHPERLPEGDKLLDAYPCMAATFASPDRRIGLGPSGRLSYQ